MMKRTPARFGIMLVVMCLLIVAVNVSTLAGKWDEILDRGYVKIGVTTGFPPFGFKENGVLKGFDIDLGKAIAWQLFGDHTKVEFIPEPPAARIPNLLNDRVDVVIQAMSITAERAKQVWFTQKYFESWIVMVVLADSPYQTLNDLAGKKVAMMRNVYAEQLVHEAVPTAQVIETEYVADSVFAVKSGRADAAYADLPCALYLMKKEPGVYRILPGFHSPQQFAFAVKPEPEDIRWYVWLNTFVSELLAGQLFYTVYEPIYVKWMGTEPPGIFWLQKDVTLGKPASPEVSVPAWVYEER